MAQDKIIHAEPGWIIVEALDPTRGHFRISKACPFWIYATRKVGEEWEAVSQSYHPTLEAAFAALEKHKSLGATRPLRKETDDA